MSDTSLVILVDDHEDSRTMYALTLASEGYEVVTAGTAEEALDLAQQLRPAVIVADVRLPGTSGLDLTRQLRGDERTRDAAILLLTGDMRTRELAAAAGFDRVLLKPFPPDLLAAEIDTARSKRDSIVSWARQLHSSLIH
jgi:CheY-like chemotaxis protein